MSLSEAVFAASWAVLCDRFGRTFNEATVKIYRRTLAAELSDEQFQQACAAAFRFETFFPTPQQLIEYGLGGQDAKTRALKRWDDMLERVRAGQSATDSPEERRLLMRATQGQPLGQIEHDRLRWVEKAWVERYAADVMERTQKATPALTDTPAAKVLPHAS